MFGTGNVPGRHTLLLNIMAKPGSGGGASGRATSFCPCGPGSNPGTDLAFLAQNSCLSILTGCQAFSKNV